MSNYYKPNRQLGLYGIHEEKPFKISRSKIDLFIKCERCFYLDRVLGIAQPPGFPFSLNSAVDKLLKKEFDIHRTNHTAHPLMKAYGLEAIPFEHPKMDEWRENFKGITYLEPATNLLITGAVDDVWVKPNGELIIVDYKSTSKESEVNLDAEWQDGYKRQMEVYQWLLRMNGFDVSNTGYFVYTTGSWAEEKFDSILKFDTHVFGHTGDTDWVEGVVNDMKKCLENLVMPPVGVAAMGGPCEHCEYAKARTQLTLDHIKK